MMGHMNIQFYGSCVSKAMKHMFSTIGFTPDFVKKVQKGFAAVDQQTKFCGELLAGDIMHMESAVIDYTSKSLTIHHRLINSATGALSYETKVTALHFDMKARKAIAFDEETLKVLQSVKIQEIAA
ncbi:hypothetical protein A9Q83_17975 [Alphaproteobacteria bacterium 46_93_T64]|nr:hypothetical protein A9Q83_17975 [Alphaproteobacteria bacterium 46_93_T64]